jgi:hypothetical protein
MINAGGLERLGFVNHQDFTLQDDGDGLYVRWMSGKSQPTEGEISTSSTAWQSEYDAQEYARNRQAEYPSINDLIVALWENVVEERAAAVISLEADRQAIKTKYPKP